MQRIRHWILFYSESKRNTDMEHLVERVKQKDQRAFKELYDLFAKPMYNICLRIMNHEQDANDVLQESFVKVFQNIHQLQKAELFPAWIKRICVNTAIQAVKTKKKMILEEWDDVPGMVNLQDEQELVEEAAFEKNIHEIHEAIKKLPDRYRIVFSLHVLEDYSHEEIAKMLGIVSGTSRSQYLRAKQKLIELIKKNKNNVRSFEKVYSAS
ncbi:MAG: RNA polymerase sigma factor [Saprospiraceae bacterium]|nr:RNA polymerase sigma factor [Saprospiraceae bacterium]MBK7738538.1 RNA polymerase sigma factor [Saprospiraceae bacterium]MBK7912890.1 RNA polymerase sigma factor [Saprospiraceae bacterium]